MPLGAAAAVLLVLASWQVLQLLFPDGTQSPAASNTTSEPAAVSLQVRIDDAGLLHVVETVMLESPRKALDLSVPERAGAGKEFRPVISSLVVRVPGPVGEVPEMGVGDEETVELPSESARIVLEYDASGVAVRSGDPSNPERALALVTPLVVAQGRGLPWSVAIDSVKVLNVGCLRDDLLTGCGTKTSEGWTVETSGVEGEHTFDVLAQLNLAVP
ncbi:MAG TPA: hypothetical protein VFT00_03625 [Nocardioides sp.]|nr:hypothetical protein [Nocardioides sp.]